MSSPQYPYPPPPPPPSYIPPPPPEGSNLKLALAAGAIVASLAANGFLFYQIHELRADSAHNQQIIQSEIDTVKENSTVMTAAQRKHLEDLKEELDNRSRQLSQAASQAKREALTYADEKAKGLEAEQQQAKQQLSSSISEVNQKAESANARVADVNNDVSGVKTDLASTKNDLASTKTDLSQTKTNLQKVAGDLSGTNSLVATNGQQIEELRRRGERNIVEFTLKKQKNLQKVGDIQLLLEKADMKKNKFNLVVMADDKKVEKKDRNINEPLQFYVSRSLYEVVVNTVGKDSVSGYLSTPKYQNR